MNRRTSLPLCMILALLLSLSFQGCGSSSNKSGNDSYSGAAPAAKETYSSARPYATPAPVSSTAGGVQAIYEDSAPLAMGEMDYYEETTAEANEGSGSSSAIDPSNTDGPQLDEKLVYTGSLSVQTLEYDDCVAGIRQKIKSFNGIIQSESETDDDYHWYYDDHVNSSTRSLYLTIRIPSAKFYEFLSSVGEEGKVINKSVNVENISQTYSDTKTQIEALEIEEKRLLDMMEKADTIEDMIAVESRLTEVQSDLNYYKTNLRGMDTDVAWSTISLSVEEVKKYSPTVVEQTFGEKVREAFSDAWNSFVGFLQGLVLVLIELLPFLILLLIIILLIRFILKKTAPRREARRLEKEIRAAQKHAEKQARKQEALMRQRVQMPAPPYNPGYPPYGGPAAPANAGRQADTPQQEAPQQEAPQQTDTPAGSSPETQCTGVPAEEPDRGPADGE